MEIQATESRFEKKAERILHRLSRFRFIFLSLSLAFYIFLPPFLERAHMIDVVHPVLLTLLILACCFIFIRNRRSPLFFWMLLSLIILLNWLSHYEILHPAFFIPIDLVFLIFYSGILVIVIRQILLIRTVNEQVIMGAIAGYGLLGIICGVLGHLVHKIYPQAFHFPEQVVLTLYEYSYFSFVTMSTLGYGDIIPSSTQGEAVTILISLAGQFYMTILVAILVGKYLIHFHQKTRK